MARMLRAAALKRVPLLFYKSDAGNELVRDWLKALTKNDRKIIGLDLKTAELGWPIGMPLVKPLGQGLYEVRSSLSGNRISRVFICHHDGNLVALHAIIKKTQKTPKADLKMARDRIREVKGK